MQAKLFTQVFSFSLAAVITVAVLAGIDHQAQPDAAHPHVAQAQVSKG